MKKRCGENIKVLLSRCPGKGRLLTEDRGNSLFTELSEVKSDQGGLHPAQPAGIWSKRLLGEAADAPAAITATCAALAGGGLRSSKARAPRGCRCCGMIHTPGHDDMIDEAARGEGNPASALGPRAVLAGDHCWPAPLSS